MAQFASVILLFVTGLHTDLKQFLRYVGPATVIAAVGLILPFALGTATVYIPFFADITRAETGPSVLVPALFVGAILAATSIGITARVLGDINKLDTPEGVTIIGAAVLDDVFGIIALAIVAGIASTGSVSIGTVSMIAAKALGFWIALTLIVLLLAKPIERAIMGVKYHGATVALGLALAFACSAAAEGFGLAFIIGAYSVGLGLSQTKMAHKLMDELRPINDFLVPIFFAALGMLVDFNAMLSDWRVIVFGLVVTLAAIIGKLIGCGAAAYATGFNLRGAYRIGLGMMPRGEVALIVAGIGLSRGIIQENIFGVSIMMTLLTTILAPILLVPAFAKGGSGRAGRVTSSSSPG
jgi:Kef-type K+ transport system membrane component KefB